MVIISKKEFEFLKDREKVYYDYRICKVKKMVGSIGRNKRSKFSVGKLVGYWDYRKRRDKKVEEKGLCSVCSINWDSLELKR